MGGPLGDVLDSIISDFNRKSQIKVIGVKMGNYNTLSQKLIGPVQTGKLPTLSQMYEAWASEFIESKKLENMEEFYRNLPDSLKNDIFMVMIEQNKWGDTLWTFPFNKSVPVFFYNKDLFKKFGIKKFPETWEEFRKVAELFRSKGYYATAFPVSVWLYLCMLYQKGGRVLVGDSVVFNSKEGIEALEYLVGLVKDSLAYITTGYKHQDDFIAQKIPMVFGTIVSYSFMKPKIKFNFGIAPLPYFKDGKRVVILSGTNVGMFKTHDTLLRKVAFNFLKFFLRSDIQKRWAKGTGYLPLRRSVAKNIENEELRKVILQVEYADFEPRRADWLIGRRLLSTEGLEPALRGFLSPKDALNRAAKFYQAEIKRRKILQ